MLMSEVGLTLGAGLAGAGAAHSALRGSGCGEWEPLIFQERRVGI